MDREDVIALLRQSFRSPTSTPHVSAPDREAYISANQDLLIGHAIEPELVEAHTTQWVREFTDFTLDSYEFLRIALDGDRELLYSEATKEFSLAIRNKDGKLYLVGYSSTDALAEWLG